MTLWTDLATWRGPTKNNGGRRSKRVRGMCLHIAVGYFEGTISHQRNPANEVSSHFIVGRAGQVAQMVDTADVSWTQSAGNQEWLTVEFEGFPKGHELWRPDWERLSGFQVEAAARLFARGAAEFGYPLQLCGSPSGYGLGHHSMGGAAWGGHYSCPGVPILAQKGEITARAQAIAEPAPGALYSEVKAGWAVDQWILDLQKGYGAGAAAKQQGKPVLWDIIARLNPGISSNINWHPGDHARNTFKAGARYRVA